ncbi:uncharacterized protein LOC133192426 [Saccostrea echinata]|uniref:uncharacterized protein LOC133192426 n=1 Tax=Saccostrea echinata TaxID=191078 RepID=UPI002A81FCB0|nr:uncharacterized protein LOC133192426 [Saccostrea echinata]
MYSKPGENVTTTPFYPQPDNSLPIHTRDTYLLIATFVSVLIIMGIVIAFINRKCRDSLSKARFRLLHLRHHDVLTTGHRRRHRRTSTKSMTHHIHSLHDPYSPVYSKEVNAPVSFFTENRTVPKQLKRKMGSSDSMYESGSCSSGAELDSGISVISSKTEIPTCSMPECRSLYDKARKKRSKPELCLAPDVKLVRVLMPETLEQGDNEVPSAKDNGFIYHQHGKMSKKGTIGNPKRYSVHLDVSDNNRTLRSRLSKCGLGEITVHSTGSPGRKHLDEFDHQSSFDVISMSSIEEPVDENFNSAQIKGIHELFHSNTLTSCRNSKCDKETKIIASLKSENGFSDGKQTLRKPGTWTSKSSSIYKPSFISSSGSFSSNHDHNSDQSVFKFKNDTTSHNCMENQTGLNSLLPSFQEFGEFLEERRRKLSN